MKRVLQVFTQQTRVESKLAIAINQMIEERRIKCRASKASKVIRKKIEKIWQQGYQEKAIALTEKFIDWIYENFDEREKL